jgi:hypothetical protein
VSGRLAEMSETRGAYCLLVSITILGKQLVDIPRIKWKDNLHRNVRNILSF